MLSSFSAAAAAVFIYMSILFLVALLLKDNSIVDIAWGPGFILVALTTLALRSGLGTRPMIVSGLVVIWGLRLAAHIFLRNRSRGEDFRYAKWRREWGRWFIPRSFFQVFMLQGLLMLVIASPIVLVNRSEAKGLTVLDGAGVLLWLVGFLFEAVGDAQLTRFKRMPDSKGRIMTSGLWKITRHPN